MKNPEDQDRDPVSPDDTIEMKAGVGDSPGNLPTKIGQYVIKRVIASGGMGTVFEALQENPRRPAAVKVIRSSMASEEALRRFEREAQALARLRHPGIAQIYEAGTYEDAGVSLPFFALEYIPSAKTIIEYARAKSLDTRQKLDLFLQVCEAVHYGHQRGIIHRDLKPGNILVDPEGRVRIIDFGVARAIDSDLEAGGSQTQVGQIVGTAQYMSPEQFAADPHDLDTRSDVYALGVVLYELLAGRLPYGTDNSGVFEIARLVREEQPDALGGVVPGIHGEIELIVDKALQKDRDHRYQSAYGLAADIRRHLKGEAISAKPTSVAYQARVFARKNKAVVGLAAAAVAVLVVGVAWTSKLYVDISAEQSRSEAAAARAIAANDFLKNTLQAVVPLGYGDVRTIGDLCDQVAQDIDGAFPGNPTTEADIRHTIGMIYFRLDQRPQAESQLRKAHQMRSGSLGGSHELSMQALADLHYFYSVFGPGDKRLETAREYHEIALAKFGPEDGRTLDAQEDVIGGLDSRGEYAAAERMARDLCAMVEKKWGKESSQALDAGILHAMLQLEAGHLGEARASAYDVYELCSRVETAEPWDVRATKNAYAATLVAEGEIEAAKELYEHRRAPEQLGVVHEYQGTPGSMDEAVKVMVFFETWCPYSQRYISGVERLSRSYRGLGVEVIGLTKVNRSSSDDDVRRFIDEYDLTFSVLKENGRATNYFDPSGVPHTVVLHEGEVIWESAGTIWLNSRMLEGIVNAD